MRARCLLLVNSLALLGACGSEPNKAAMPVPQHQLDALEKAKQVEEQLRKATKKREEEMREKGV